MRFDSVRIPIDERELSDIIAKDTCDAWSLNLLSRFDLDASNIIEWPDDFYDELK